MANTQQLLEQADWYIVPIVNVDGYLYTWSNATSARYWRKNRHEFDVNVYGVGTDRMALLSASP